jgi:hypothetical protein
MCVLPVRAGTVAGMGGSTEITQLMNNMELAAVGIDSAATSITQAQSYVMQQIQNYRQMLNALNTNPLTKLSNIADVKKTLDNLKKFRSALTNLTGSVDKQKSFFDKRITEAKLLKLTAAQYIEKNAIEIEQGNEKAKARLVREEAILEQVEADYAFVKEKQDELGGDLGTNQALDVMNSQMNRIVQQNAQMIAIMAKANNSEINDKEIAERENRAALGALAIQRDAAREALRERQKKWIPATNSSGVGI